MLRLSSQLRSRRDRRDRGAALVEFAIVIPLLLLLMFGIIEFGLGMYRLQGMHSASRDAARIGSYQATTQDQIEERALASLESTALQNPVEIAIEPDVEFPCADSDEVVVTLTSSNPIRIPFFGERDITLHSRAEFVCER